MSKSINYSNYGQQGDRVRKAQEPNNTSAFCNVLFHGTMAAFFYVYAFRNPDYDYCWASTIGDVRFAFEIEDAFLETTNVSETFRPDDAGVTLVAVGDGVTPRTAALFAFRTAWQTVAIDPLMTEPGEWSKRVERLTAVRAGRSKTSAAAPEHHSAAKSTAAARGGAPGSSERAAESACIV